MTLNQDFHDGMIAAASGSEWCDTAICTDCDDETTAANGLMSSTSHGPSKTTTEPQLLPPM